MHSNWFRFFKAVSKGTAINTCIVGASAALNYSIQKAISQNTDCEISITNENKQLANKLGKSMK